MYDGGEMIINEALLESQRRINEAKEMTQSIENYEWQPIETAPKNRAILVWDGKHIDHVLWEIVNINSSIGWWKVRSRGEGAEYGDYGHYPVVDKPTHWMLLPEPPK